MYSCIRQRRHSTVYLPYFVFEPPESVQEVFCLLSDRAIADYSCSQMVILWVLVVNKAGESSFQGMGSAVVLWRE